MSETTSTTTSPPATNPVDDKNEKANGKKKEKKKKENYPFWSNTAKRVSKGLWSELKPGHIGLKDKKAEGRSPSFKRLAQGSWFTIRMW